jgi:hypothetical protein
MNAPSPICPRLRDRRCPFRESQVHGQARLAEHRNLPHHLIAVIAGLAQLEIGRTEYVGMCHAGQAREQQREQDLHCEAALSAVALSTRTVYFERNFS